MSKFTYTVEIPPLHQLLLGLESKMFENENPILAKKDALGYLSKVFVVAFEKKLLRISDFENEDSKFVSELETLKPYFFNGDRTVDFEKILECKIDYVFAQNIIRHTMRTNNLYGRLQEKLDSYGFLELRMTTPKSRHSSCVLTVNNNDNRNYSEYKISHRYIAENNLKIEKTKQGIPFFEREKKREMKRLFLDNKNQFEKEIFSSKSFIKFEKIYLSFLNTPFSKFLFIPDEEMSFAKNILNAFEKIYPHQTKFTIYTDIEIDEKKYVVFVHNTKEMEKELIFSNTGKIFIRDNYGVKKIDKNTSLKQVFENYKTDPEIEKIMKII